MNDVSAAPVKVDVRGCFVPRPGNVYVQADFPGLELYTLAEVCMELFGESALGDVLRAGLDPHLALAAEIMGIDYAEAKARKATKEVKNARDMAKVANFGIPGGLGVDSLIEYARSGYGVILDGPGAKSLKNRWLTRWPEMRKFFAASDRPRIEQLYTKRFRGGLHFTAACNTRFQGLGADCAKRALYLVTRACYTEVTNPLYGAFPVCFVHDEIFLECLEAFGHECAMELARLMVKGANTYLKHVPIALEKMEPALMRRWSKDATQIFDNGKLIPWDRS